MTERSAGCHWWCCLPDGTRDLSGTVRSASTKRCSRCSSQALIDPSWSIVEHYEREGRHYLVVVEKASVSPGLELLSPRELQVLAAAAIGQTNKVIAFELGLSDSTVRVHLARSGKKLRVNKRAELVALYLAHVAAPSVE